MICPVFQRGLPSADLSQGPEFGASAPLYPSLSPMNTRNGQDHIKNLDDIEIGPRKSKRLVYKRPSTFHVSLSRSRRNFSVEKFTKIPTSFYNALLHRYRCFRCVFPSNRFKFPRKSSRSSAVSWLDNRKFTVLATQGRILDDRVAFSCGIRRKRLETSLGVDRSRIFTLSG